MDFVLAILPWHVVITLNMKRKEKITITVALSLGVIAGICSIIRTVKLKSLSSTDEYVYRTATMLLWSSSEICLTVICACIPFFDPYTHASDMVPSTVLVVANQAVPIRWKTAPIS